MALVLLNPGPVNVSPRVRAALAGPDICHREPEFAAVMGSIRARLVRCFGDPDTHDAVVLTGSGTLAVEAMIASGVGSGRLLVINNGVYGERMLAMARAHGIAAVDLKSPWTQPPSPDAVESALRAEPAVEAIALVHHETTTGLLNPVAPICRLAREHGVRVLLDSVSGLGGDPLDLAAAGVDFCAGTASKCLQGVPGISFVIVRRGVLDSLAANSPRSVYLHLPAHLAAQQRGSTLFTMAVHAAYAGDAALAELEEETVAGRNARYRAAAAYLRQGFDTLGLSCILPPAVRSNSLTALRLPRGLDYPTLHARLKRCGFVIYAGQGDLEGEVFRVANMGHLDRSHFTTFLDALAESLSPEGRRNAGGG